MGCQAIDCVPAGLARDAWFDVVISVTTPPKEDCTGDADAPAVCTGRMGWGFTSVGDAGGSCGQGESYSCGVDSYQIECSCPAATCTCKRGGTVVKTVAYGQCPSCTIAPMASYAQVCGLPY